MSPTASRRAFTLILALAAVVLLSACDQEPSFGSGPEKPQTLIASTTWVQSSDGAETQSRLTELQAAIDELRSATASGWVGTQDDITGYLTELSGGRYFGDQGADSLSVVESFLDEYGTRLFGVGYDGLQFGDEEAPDANGSSVIRAQQVFEGIPVLDVWQ